MYAGSGTRVLRKLDGRQRTVGVQNEFWGYPCGHLPSRISTAAVPEPTQGL